MAGRSASAQRAGLNVDLSELEHGGALNFKLNQSHLHLPHGLKLFQIRS